MLFCFFHCVFSAKKMKTKCVVADNRNTGRRVEARASEGSETKDRDMSLRVAALIRHASRSLFSSNHHLALSTLSLSTASKVNWHTQCLQRIVTHRPMVAQLLRPPSPAKLLAEGLVTCR